MNMAIKNSESGFTKSDRVYRQLAEALANGQWFPGERLPVERDLAEMCHCSRVTLRSALERLSKQNLIYRKQGSGTYVTDEQCRPQSCNIALIERSATPDFAESTFLNQQMLGFMKIASQKQFMTNVIMIDNHTDFFTEAARLEISLSYFDGFIFAYPLTAVEIAELHKRKIRFVSLTEPIDNDGSVSYVDIDNQQGMYQATCHLLELGYRRPVLLNGPAERPYNQAKKLGFQKALNQFQVPFDETAMVYTIEPNDSESAEQVINALLEKPEYPLDSLLIYGDWSTYGAVQALRQHKLRIPEDIALVRYNDGTWVDKVLNLPVTSVQQPLEEQIAAASEMLLRLIERKSNHCMMKILQPTLLIRKSSGIFLQSEQ